MSQSSEQEITENNSDKVIPRMIEEEMKQAYVTYAMSVIAGRALPDVKDGLKPVHRRILYSMFEQGMLSTRPFKKSARIVGDVLGKYHPHGDGAIYDSLVRMAQHFSLRYPLIKGQGNFGSIDGDNAAAMRYTEAKLFALAEVMLKELPKQTVDFRENFDGSLKEPVVLPSKVPNLLINGSSGIAVGMATNIPPHNLSEISDALVTLLDNPDATVEELMQHVKGPDFPTGAEVLVGSSLVTAYHTGRGRVKIKSIVSIEEKRLIVTEIPYMVNKADLIIQIAGLVKDKRVEGIRNINDESDQDGIRVVIDLKQGADAQIVLNQLYKYSNLKTSFSLNLLSLVNGQPKLLGLKEMLWEFIVHRKDVVTRRTQYELKQAEERLHILEGLLIALLNLDEVIPGIRKSQSVDDAKAFLISSYSLSEIQAKAILDMRLQKLASLEREKIRAEHTELEQIVLQLRSILSSEEKIYGIIREETLEMKEKFGDIRRSRISLNADDDDIDIEDLIEEEQVVVTRTHSGYFKRVPLDTYRTQGRGGKGMVATKTKDDDVVEELFVCSTHAYLLFFTDQGRVHWLKVYKLPEGSRQSKGRHVANLVELQEGEKVSAAIPIREFDDSSFLFMATKQGTVKKTSTASFSRPRRGGIRALELSEGDCLVGVKLTTGSDQIILCTHNGIANRFAETDVRAMGRTARGVRGISLGENDYLVAVLVADERKQILTITEAGYGKRSDMAEYRLCKRGGKGVINIKINEKNKQVIAAKLVTGSEQLMLISEQGVAIRTAVEGISKLGRSTQGVRVMRLNDEDKVAAAALIVLEDDDSAEE